jgi:hypothetical protein
MRLKLTTTKPTVFITPRNEKCVHVCDNQELIPAAPNVILQCSTTKYSSYLRMSLNEIKKQFQIAGKGHNVLFEIAILMKHTTTATHSVDGHVSENGGTCQFTKLCESEEEEGVSGLDLMSKEEKFN